MSEISTISEFLLHAGTEYRVFDMGRCIKELDAQSFLHMEHGQMPVPRPRQAHMWCGIVFYNRTTSAHHYVWFIKLPIDEQGCIVGAARQHFLQIIIDALGDTFEPQTDTQAQLPDNPYTFVPPQALLADFNSYSRRVLGLPPSKYYREVEQFLSSPTVIDWRALAHQGISDLAAQLSDAQLQTKLLNILSGLPATFVTTLFSALEHYDNGTELNEKMIDIARKSGDQHLVLTALRGLSGCRDNTEMSALLSDLLNSPDTVSQDLLTVIAGRHWHRFNDRKLLNQFLEACATFENGRWFSGLYRDLVQIPSIREEMLKAIRNPDRSEAMSQAIGTLFSGAS